MAVTFDRHPNSVVAPERTPPLLCPLWRKLRALERTGLDAGLVFAFDEPFSRQSGEAFVDRLCRAFPRLAGIHVGRSFVFGHGRSGNLELLTRLGERRGFAVHGVAPIEVDGEIVSSTRLRELVSAGELDRAEKLLGRRHGLAGVVEVGDRIGRQLGFPTANLGVSGLALPPQGVYAAFALGDDGFRHPAAVNIGRRPTIDGSPGPLRVEAHLPDFEGDLYGRRLELELHWRIRSEERFPSRQALVARIGRDVAEVRVWAGNKGLP